MLWKVPATGELGTRTVAPWSEQGLRSRLVASTFPCRGWAAGGTDRQRLGEVGGPGPHSGPMALSVHGAPGRRRPPPPQPPRTRLTHLGALGCPTAAPGGSRSPRRSPCPALRAASWCRSQGACRQVPLSSGVSGPSVFVLPEPVVSGPLPSAGSWAEVSGNAAQGLRLQGRAQLCRAP